MILHQRICLKFGCSEASKHLAGSDVTEEFPEFKTFQAAMFSATNCDSFKD